ncbi:MAG: hypothetical protein KGJ11_08445, partial [Candidatus Omnitrophica bacterium]|nr:hypothetical protein [Candidatus Omnitrophota bacterium]
MFKNFQKGISIAILVVFLVASIKSPSYAQLSQDSMPRLPAPGSMVNLSQAYVPVLIRGITFDSKDPFKFNFIIDTGNSGLRADNPQLKHESTKLIKYFLAALTIPEHDLWVNLSPYEKARMLPDSLRQTGMGRDMLAQDYLLKQVTASLIYPQKKLGREFWNKVYAKAQAEYGTTQIPVNTYNKVWIVADKADVFERNQSAFVMDAHLKVMLNEDYLAMKEHKAIHNDTDSIGSKIVRQIVLPELEKEVNTGKNFAPVRQMFYSMILASWYKMALKKAVVNQLYADKNKVGVGIAIEDKTTAYKIYERYIQAYKKGVFNYISEEDVNGRSVPRKYFSGGLRILPNPAMIGRHRDVKSALAALTSFVGSAVLVSTALLTGLQNAGAQSAGVINFPPSEFQGIDSQGHALSFHPPDPKNLNYGFVVNGSNLWGQYYFYPASGTNEAGAQGILVVEPDDSNLPMTVAPVNLTQESIPAGVFTVDRGVYWNNQKAVLSFALKNNPNTATAQSEVAALKSSGFTSGNGFVAPSKSGGLNISSVVNGFLQLEALKSTVVPTGTIFSDQNNRVNFQLSALGGSYS